jgi:hypothetical protein
MASSSRNCTNEHGVDYSAEFMVAELTDTPIYEKGSYEQGEIIYREMGGQCSIKRLSNDKCLRTR